jgi:DNA-binding response OmpR family regulator
VNFSVSNLNLADKALTRMLPHSSKRLLVVDDDPAVLESVRRVLALDGHTIECVPDAEQALNALGRSRFDLLVTDYLLPGVNGLRLAETAKKKGHCHSVLMITAFPQDHPSGAIDLLLLKPFSVESLRGGVWKLLNNSRLN